MELLELLRRDGAIGAAELETALKRSRSAGEDLATAIWMLRLLPEHELVRLLADVTGYPGIDLRKSVIPSENVDLIDGSVMSQRFVLPVVDAHGGLVLAMANPADDSLVAEISFHTGRKVLRHVAVKGALKSAIDGCLKIQGQRGEQWKGKEAWSLNPGPHGRAAIVRPSVPGTGAAAVEANVPVVTGVELDIPERGELDLSEAAEPAFLDSGGRWIDPEKIEDVADSKTTVRKQAGAGKVVLVVDDDPALRALVVKLLQPLGCAILESGDGREALALARDARPNLIILDAMLPGMHGFEVCRAVKGDAALRKSAVLMMSGIHTGWRVGVDVAEVYGADGFFEKPFRTDDFSRAVKRLLAVGGGEEKDAAKARRQAALDTCKEASARAKAGRMRDAIALLRVATSKDPYSAEPHFYLGRALLAVGDPYRAIASLEKAVDLRPDVEAPVVELATAYEKLGFRKSAGAAFRRAAEAVTDPTRRSQHVAKAAALERG